MDLWRVEFARRCGWWMMPLHQKNLLEWTQLWRVGSVHRNRLSCWEKAKIPQTCALFQRQSRLRRPNTCCHSPSYVVNPLKRDHDLSSLSPKLFMSCQVVNEIIYCTKSCQTTLSLESCLENHRGAVTGMGEASSHSLRRGHLEPQRKTDNKFLFLSFQGLLAISFYSLLLSICGYFNVEFIWLSLCRAHQQPVPAVIPTTSLLWESTKEQDQRPRKKWTAREKGQCVTQELLCKQEY